MHLIVYIIHWVALILLWNFDLIDTNTLTVCVFLAVINLSINSKE